MMKCGWFHKFTVVPTPNDRVSHSDVLDSAMCGTAWERKGQMVIK